MAAWNLLLGHGPKFLYNYLARVPITPNQQGTHQMIKLLPSARVQEMDLWCLIWTTAFHWENSELEKDAVFCSGEDNFSLSASDDIEMGSAAKDFLLDDEEDKKNSPPLNPASNRPNRRPVSLTEELSFWNHNRNCS